MYGEKKSELLVLILFFFFHNGFLQKRSKSVFLMKKRWKKY